MENDIFNLDVIGKTDCLWQLTLKNSGRIFTVAPPVFEVDGHEVALWGSCITPVSTRLLANGANEHIIDIASANGSHLHVQAIFRIAPDNPVVRFRYRLLADVSVQMTKKTGSDNLSYGTWSVKDYTSFTEVRFSEYDTFAHCYRVSERDIPIAAFENGCTLCGPLVAAHGPGAWLMAYEHGSTVPDAFVSYTLNAEKCIELKAIKANYSTGQVVDPQHPYETLWFHMAATNGTLNELTSDYRTFILRYQAEYTASRRPYIFYNTWDLQSRVTFAQGKSTLEPMTTKRILAEIDSAARMGIDVFVLDTGWFDKAGDWRVHQERFPDGLKDIRERLTSHGMKLGLWFGPAEAALTSNVYLNNRDCVTRYDRTSYIVPLAPHDDDSEKYGGTTRKPYPVWGSETSQRMCLVSRYASVFADELIRIAKELGVTYFKFDAVDANDCDGTCHDHGDATLSAQERRDRFSFLLPHYLVEICERVSAACPDAIVDFDISEPGRSVGLSFLAAGKYFHTNNGPYFSSFDIPQSNVPDTLGGSVFVYPGPARAGVCRVPLDVDRWLPSVLFMTHYFPDNPLSSQMINLASLILGQNGIWGNLQKVSEEGIALFGTVLGLYKQVAVDITNATPVRSGRIGGSPEVHEKLSSNGRGCISIFAATAGEYHYITTHSASTKFWASPGVHVRHDKNGLAILSVKLETAGAAFILFGIDAGQ